MKKKTKKDNQHIIPKTYLKYFQISEGESFVYCIDTSDKYNAEVKKRGINHKIFKRKKYYNTHRFENPYIIEDILGQIMEPQYNGIMKEVNKELPLKSDTIEKLINWLFISKLRSPHLRDNTERVLNWSLRMMEQFHNKDISTEKEEAIKRYSEITARDIHLNTITERDRYKKLLELHVETLNAKHWKILKSDSSLPFWTNDNPGFSPNLHPALSERNPFHSIMELNGQSIIYYVLSPKYCLEITPFMSGTPLNICALNMEIKYENASSELTNYINRGVLNTRINLVISNQKEVFELFTKQV